jgi:TetR/AcrR family transcriptional regulator, cholesterol catabolism regulator
MSTTAAQGSGIAVAANQERILQVAGALFLRQGYEGTGINQISKAVGLTPPTLYWHFGSKAGILAAFLNGTIERQVELVSRYMDAKDPMGQLRQFIYAHVLYQIRYYESFDAFDANFGFTQLYASAPEDVQESLNARTDEYVEKLRSILRRGKHAGYFSYENLTVVTRALLTMAEYVFTWFSPSGPLSAEEVATQYANLAVAMVSRT